MGKSILLKQKNLINLHNTRKQAMKKLHISFIVLIAGGVCHFCEALIIFFN